MKREFRPQIWSPEVTKSPEIVPADGILPPQGTHDAWLLKYPWFCSQFFVPVLLAWKWSEARGMDTNISKTSVFKEVSAVDSFYTGFNYETLDMPRFFTQSAMFFDSI